MTRKRNKVSETLRAAVDAADRTRYRICKDAGIDQATMSRFMNGAGLSLEVVDRLAEALGLELVARRPAKRRTKGR
jgi:transcriptional regulator with XRE-family HTH domain